MFPRKALPNCLNKLLGSLSTVVLIWVLLFSRWWWQVFLANLRLSFLWNRLEISWSWLQWRGGVRNCSLPNLKSHLKFLVLILTFLLTCLYFLPTTVILSQCCVTGDVTACRLKQEQARLGALSVGDSGDIKMSPLRLLHLNPPNYRVFPTPNFICMIIWVLRLCEQWHLVVTARTMASGEEADRSKQVQYKPQ